MDMLEAYMYAFVASISSLVLCCIVIKSREAVRPIPTEVQEKDRSPQQAEFFILNVLRTIFQERLYRKPPINIISHTILKLLVLCSVAAARLLFIFRGRVELAHFVTLLFH